MCFRYDVRVCVQLVFLLCCVAPVRAAPRMMILDNPTRLMFSGFASALAVVGDVDGDGISDYLVGAYDHRWNNNEHQGRAFVYSGKRGNLLFAVDNPDPQREAAFGCAVAAAGDVNQDGVPDLLIGAFGQNGGGQAFVFSGADKQLLFTLQAPKPQVGGGFGWSVASLGDLTDDGIPELIVGAFAQDGDGRAFVFNGQNGELLHTLEAPAQHGGSAFGWSVASAGDLDQDGIPDMLVGAPYTNVGDITVQGRVYAFSGRDGKLIRTFDDPEPRAGEVFGWRVASIADLNKDGIPDILIGAPYKDIGSIPSQGAVFVFSGADGTLLFPLHNPAPTKAYSGFGFVVVEGPDINQDGAPEILVGAPYQTVDEYHVQGEMFLFNGRDGRHLTTFDNPYPHQGSMLGYSIASPGDVNGDSIPDFAAGALGQSIMDKAAVGRVFIFLSQP
jgi:hypothetical protein